MHIPDGFVSDPVNAAMAGVAGVALVASIRGLRRESQDNSFVAPLLAIASTFIFAAQMLNFSIGGGTSGHFLGAILAATLVGPWGACLALSLVLAVQGLFFADGGLTALGSNIVNMGVVGGMLSYPILRKLRRALPDGSAGFYTSVGLTSWLSIVLASAICSFELALSDTSPLAIAFPAMVGTHAIIGLGEAAISVAALMLLFRFFPSVQPSWAKLSPSQASSVNEKRLVAAGLALAVALAMFVSPFASGFPDGLEKVAEDKGFMQAASEDKVVWTASPFPDYQITSIKAEGLSTGMAGLVGSLLVFAFAMGSGRSLLTARK
ncbi:MAG: energy-coupling factor ABC transporter permease [Bdellovibrionales bacterium]